MNIMGIGLGLFVHPPNLAQYWKYPSRAQKWFVGQQHLVVGDVPHDQGEDYQF